MNDIFDKFKKICKVAAQDRKACKQGYKQLLDANNMQELLRAWRDNWEDIIGSKYSAIILAELPALYPSVKEEMNKAGIYFNECPRNATYIDKVLVGNAECVVKVYGNASAYALDNTQIEAYDHAQIYSYHSPRAKVTLYDYTYCHATCGTIKVRGRASAYISNTAIAKSFDSCKVVATGGEVYDYSHREMTATETTIIHKM